MCCIPQLYAIGNNNKYNDFKLIKDQKVYTQGDIAIYYSYNNDNKNCNDINAFVLNSKKLKVANGYCNIINQNIRIIIDTSELRQGTYYLLIENRKQKTIAKEKFEVEILDYNSLTGHTI